LVLRGKVKIGEEREGERALGEEQMSLREGREILSKILDWE
jgi:hypothetical protein